VYITGAVLEFILQVTAVIHFYRRNNMKWYDFTLPFLAVIWPLAVSYRVIEVYGVLVDTIEREPVVEEKPEDETEYNN
jgi:hypothetical protein